MYDEAYEMYFEPSIGDFEDIGTCEKDGCGKNFKYLVGEPTRFCPECAKKEGEDYGN